MKEWDLEWRAALPEAQKLELARRIQVASEAASDTLDLRNIPITHTTVNDDVLRQIRHLRLGQDIEALCDPHPSYDLDLNVVPKFSQLESLDLDNCDQLTDLSGIEAFPDLKSLSISSAYDLRSIDALESLTALESLEITYSSRIRSYRVLQDLKKLRHLKLGDAPRNVYRHLSDHPNLQSLVISPRFLGVRFYGIQQMKQVRRLVLDHSDLLNIRRIEGMDTLEEIELHEGIWFRGMEVLAKLPNLRKISYSGKRERRVLEAISASAKVRSVTINNLADVESLANLRQTELEELTLHNWQDLQDLSHLCQVPKLHSLELHGCVALKSLTGLEFLKGLRELKVTDCDRLSDISAISGLAELRTLDLSGCQFLKQHEAIGALPKLEELNLSHNRRLSQIDWISANRKLRRLTLTQCPELTTLAGIEDLEMLETVIAPECGVLESLPSFSNPGNVRQLRLDKCVRLRGIKSIEQLTNLTSLDLRRISSSAEPANFSTLTSLEEFWTSGKTQWLTISHLQSAPLRILHLTSCPWLEDLSDLVHFSALEELDVSRSDNLTSLSGVSKLTKLRHLKTRRCETLQDLSDLTDHPNLNALNISGSPLRKLILLSTLPQLRNLHFGSRNLPATDAITVATSLRQITSVTVTGIQQIPFDQHSGSVNFELPKMDTLSFLRAHQPLNDRQRAHIDAKSFYRERLEESSPHSLELGPPELQSISSGISIAVAVLLIFLFQDLMGWNEEPKFPLIFAGMSLFAGPFFYVRHTRRCLWIRDGHIGCTTTRLFLTQNQSIPIKQLKKITLKRRGRIWDRYDDDRESHYDMVFHTDEERLRYRGNLYDRRCARTALKLIKETVKECGWNPPVVDSVPSPA